MTRHLIALAALLPAPVLAGPPLQRLDRAQILRIDASSTSDARDQGRAVFAVEHLTDGTDWTPWGSQPEDRDGAWLRVRFDAVQYLGEIEFVPGNARDRGTFAACGRPARLRLEGDGEPRTLDLADRRYQQRVPLDPPLSGRSIRLVFEAVHGSGPMGGVCVSELKLMALRDPLGDDHALRQRLRRAVEQLADDQLAPRAMNELLAIGQPAVPALRDALDLSNPNLAMRAMRTLGELGDRGALRLVAPVATHADPEIRATALWTLGALRSSEHVDAIRAWYDASHADERDRAFDALARTGDPRALEVVMVELVDGTQARQASAVRHLARFGDDAVLGVQPLLSSTVVRERAAALRALGGVEVPAAAAYIEAGMVDLEPDVRAAAIAALARRGGRGAHAQIASRWRSSARVERLAVAVALGDIGDRDDLETLELLAADGSHSVRVAAARSLGRLGPTATSALRRLALMGPDGGTALAAAGAFVMQPDVSPGAAAVELLGSRHPEARALGSETLAAQGATGHAVLVAAVAGADDRIRGAAAAELRRVGERVLPDLLAAAERAPAGALPEILGLLAHFGHADATQLAARLASSADDLIIRRAAIEVLGACADARVAAAPLLAALNDRAIEVRIAAVDALGKLRVVQATFPLVELLESGPRPLQRAAARALGQIRQRTALDALVAQYQRIRDQAKDADYREDVVAAIGSIGGTDSLPILIDAMADHDRRVRAAAERSLQ